jgi:hypothetical protein
MEGGVGAFTAELAKALHALGHSVHIITSREARPPDAPRTFTSAIEQSTVGLPSCIRGSTAGAGRRWRSLPTLCCGMS